MKTVPEKFAEWLVSPESTRLEFKEANNRYDFEKLKAYCVALANEGGGPIILGVTDKRPRRVVGTAAFDEPGRTEAGLHRDLGHRIPVEEYFHEGKRVLIFHVPGRLPGMAWNLNGRFLKRAGDELTTYSEEELRVIFAETGPDFSAEVCPRASLDEISPEAIAEFRRRWARKSGNTKVESWSDSELLTNAELVTHDGVTYAALILLGTRAALGRHLAQAEVVFEYRSSEASGPAQDREEYRAGFLAFQDALWQKINLRNDKQSYQDGLFRYEILTFDETAVREALLNAVAHRDYRLGGSIFVRQYSRRLEVVSPGGFPTGITRDNLLDQQNPRNRRLAESLAKCGLIERSGQGMNLMVEVAIKQGKPLPDFTGTAAHEVRLTLPGTVQNAALVRYLEKLGEDRLRSFSTYDFLTLDAVSREFPLSELMRTRIPGLLESGAIESVGRGKGARYLLSRDLHAGLGKKGAYTRKRGLDHETNKELLLKHIRDNSKEGAPLADLCQVLPALSERSIQRLLHELRSEGKVDVTGVRRWARWIPKTSIPPQNHG